MDKENFNPEALKQSVKKWILEIDKTETIPSEIIALSFNLYEPYEIELVGSTWYDKKDGDWACDEDFVPEQRECPNFEIPNNFKWKEVLKIVLQLLKELSLELADTQVFKVKHIATGFVDGDLKVVK